MPFSPEEALRAIGQHSPGICDRHGGALGCFQWARRVAEEALGIEGVWTARRDTTTTQFNRERRS